MAVWTNISTGISFSFFSFESLSISSLYLSVFILSFILSGILQCTLFSVSHFIWSLLVFATLYYSHHNALTPFLNTLASSHLLRHEGHAPFCPFSNLSEKLCCGPAFGSGPHCVLCPSARSHENPIHRGVLGVQLSSRGFCLFHHRWQVEVDYSQL